MDEPTYTLTLLTAVSMVPQTMMQYVLITAVITILFSELKVCLLLCMFVLLQSPGTHENYPSDDEAGPLLPKGSKVSGPTCTLTVLTVPCILAS